MDQQVKIRGFRIELGDIEATLSRHPAVAQAAVTVWKVNRDDQRLSAYIVPVQGQEGLDSVSLRKFVRKSLPAYMVPTYFTAIDGLPLTNNGKIDREALPLPAADERSRTEEPPATSTEIAIAEIWRALLATESIESKRQFLRNRRQQHFSDEGAFGDFSTLRRSTTAALRSHGYLVANCGLL
jgi:hypothetical protein